LHERNERRNDDNGDEREEFSFVPVRENGQAPYE
jgi:hypothetical protein